MNRSAFLTLLLAACAPAARAEDFTAAVKAIVAQTAAAKPLAVQGTDRGWFFLSKELAHLANGDLATADLAQANVEKTDPLPVIAKYNEELKTLGVELLLVPVPEHAPAEP